MTPTTIHIVCGPQSCGRTRNAERMKEYFKADVVEDIPLVTKEELERTITKLAMGKPQTVVLLSQAKSGQMEGYAREILAAEKAHELMAGVSVTVHYFDYVMMAMADAGLTITTAAPIEDTPEAGKEDAAPTYLQPTTRKEAQALVAVLQRDFDLIDDAEMLRNLIEEMEARHEDGFNAFFETILARFLEAVGQKEVTFNTENMMAEMFAPSRLQCSVGVGTLTYRLQEKKDD